jgi:3-ketosteroid 9alpha-monooxygenase subunit A
MKVPFTWKPTGWFMVGWSADVPTGTVKPLQYFGGHQVAYRDELGEVHVLDAHCPHLGAHIGHGGKVRGECIECPYHGWGYGPDGVNRYIPYEDRPNVSKRLKSWPVTEQHECIFVWHDPHDGPPRWELPSVFDIYPEVGSTDPADYYRAYPELSDFYSREPVHPQITLENAPDSVHFKYVHDAGSDPVLEHWEATGNEYRTIAGWPNPKSNSPDDISLRIYSTAVGVGASLAVFDGVERYRLIFFTTPVDDETSDMFYSIWWPRQAGDDAPVPSPGILDRIRERYLQTLSDDLEIWRYQIYIETPAFAQRDARPYGALRKWARQFYEIEPVA